MPPTVPAWLEANWWLVDVLGPWFLAERKKGDVLLSFRFGRVTRTEEKEVRDGAEHSTRRVDADGSLCPDCHRPMSERDYGQKYYCGTCDKTWPTWKVEQMNREVTEGRSLAALRQPPPKEG